VSLPSLPQFSIQDADTFSKQILTKLALVFSIGFLALVSMNINAENT
jgi:hypothetical protein